MARYRPPAAAKSPYITAEGFERLQAEEKTIWKRRRQVVRILSAAAAEGDRSENAEYIYRKKELRGIDRRIRYLQQRLPTLIVAGAIPDNILQVFFGARVTMEDERGVEHRYRIVGPDEFDQHRDYISMDSPMAKALLKRHLDDEVNVRAPDGARSYIITQINYD
jgi:transcription elongation factor GreB